MRRVSIVLAAISLFFAAFAGPAMAAGNSEAAQLHPGHQGYVSSDGANAGAAPVNHFGAHGGPGYESGPGGWGHAVSETAKAAGGLKKAHGG